MLKEGLNVFIDANKLGISSMIAVKIESRFLPMSPTCMTLSKFFLLWFPSSVKPSEEDCVIVQHKVLGWSCSETVTKTGSRDCLEIRCAKYAVGDGMCISYLL